jgi:hypothetical protein
MYPRAPAVGHIFVAGIRQGRDKVLAKLIQFVENN